MSHSPDWHTDAFPELRAAPPWVMQEMIAAEPAMVEGLLSRPPSGLAAAADVISAVLGQGRPVTVSGCGTSEHAAHGVAAMLRAAVGPEKAMLVQARPAFSAAQDPRSGVCLAVSHDGETTATALSLTAARSAGARTIAITHQADGPVAGAADHVLVTPVHDVSWCHTVAYTSALTVGAALATHVGPFAAEPAAARELLARATGDPAAAAIAARLADRRVILCAGAEACDLTTARELALKIAEATHVPTTALELETVLHGQLAAAEPADALVLVATGSSGDPVRTARRATDVARAAATIGLRIAGLLSDGAAEATGTDPFPDGVLVTELPPTARLAPSFAGLLAGAGALQTLTLELAHARHVNPDLIRREQAPYREAAAAADRSAGS